MKAQLFHTQAFHSFMEKLTKGTRPAEVALARLSFVRQLVGAQERVNSVLKELSAEHGTGETLPNGFPKIKKEHEEVFAKAFADLHAQDIPCPGFTLSMLGTAELGPDKDGTFDDTLIAEALLGDTNKSAEKAP